MQPDTAWPARHSTAAGRNVAPAAHDMRISEEPASVAKKTLHIPSGRFSPSSTHGGVAPSFSNEAPRPSCRPVLDCCLPRRIRNPSTVVRPTSPPSTSGPSGSDAHFHRETTTPTMTPRSNPCVISRGAITFVPFLFHACLLGKRPARNGFEMRSSCRPNARIR